MIHFLINVLFFTSIGAVVVTALMVSLYLLHSAIRTPPLPKPDYKRIEALERELKLGPPYVSQLPQIEKPTKIERVW